MRFALGVEYCGVNFAGWQRQPEGRSVQACIEAALSRVADHPVGVHCAGRTDQGVHATGQVIHFDSQADRAPHAWVLGANAHLPEDVCALWARPVPDEFHARYSATARTYRYLILNRRARPALLAGRVTWERRPLDADRMHAAAAALIGEHDFSSFRAQDCQSHHAIRAVHDLRVERRGEFVVIEISANAFLYRMVRNIAGVLIAVGTGRSPPEWPRELLALRDRALGGVTAPPDGLYLVEVVYPGKYGLPRAGRERPVARKHAEAIVDPAGDILAEIAYR
jgi:tRNA pseudouridine38-40 synthase